MKIQNLYLHVTVLKNIEPAIKFHWFQNYAKQRFFLLVNVKKRFTIHKEKIEKLVLVAVWTREILHVLIGSAEVPKET